MKKLIAIITLFGITQAACTHKCSEDTGNNNNCDIIFRDDNSVEREFREQVARCVRDKICRN